MVGGAAPHGRPQVTQEGHVGRRRALGNTGERGNLGRGEGTTKWTDCVAEDQPVLDSMGYWSTSALNPGAY